MRDNLIVDTLKGEAAFASSYERGLALAVDGAVSKLQVVEGVLGSTVSLDAKVEGSHGNLYHTTAELDLEKGELLDYFCTCPAAMSYPGMCKHEIALVLEFLAREGIGPVIAKRSLASTYARRGTSTRSNIIPLTSGPIRDLMDAFSAKRLSDAEASRRSRLKADGDKAELAELIPTILPVKDTYSYGADDWCVKLRVRRGKAAYVVKNIAALVDAYRYGDKVTYGKNLSFTHTPDAFDERARAVIELIGRVTDSQRAMFYSRWRYQEAGRGADIKDLPMGEADLVDLLDLYQGSTVLFQQQDDPYAYTASKPRTLQVVEGEPDVRIVFKPARDGYDMDLTGVEQCFSAGSRLYAISGSRAISCSEEYAERAATILVTLSSGKMPMRISSPDLPAFCRDILPALRATFDVTAPEELDGLVPPEAEFTFRVGIDDGRVTCAVTVAYGSWETELYGSPQEAPRTGKRKRKEKPQPERDLVAEYRVMDTVEELFPGGNPDLGDLPGFDEDDDERLYDLITQGLQELDSLGEVLLSERLRRIEVRESPRFTVRATIRSGLLDVALDTSGMSTADLEAYLASYKRHQRFVRLSNGDIMRMGENAATAVDLAEGLGVDAEQLAEGATGLPVNRVMFVDGLLKRTEGLRLSRNAAFRQIVRDFDTFADADIEVPASLADVLRPYQQDGFRWLQTLERFGFGGILADDMGLGKTLQVIAHILACKERGAGAAGTPADKADSAGPTLVVCPASLVYNWMSELARFAPALDAVAVLGAKKTRCALIADAPSHDVLVTSYDLMKRDIDACGEQMFTRVVLDEAHYIKNPSTQVSRAARCLPARVRFALTGTPIENRTSELWSIFDFLMPGVLGSRERFAKTYEGPIEGGDAHATERLRCLTSPFILRRLKTDVLSDLPDKTESVVRAHMSGEQDKLYRANQDRLARQIAHEMPQDFKRQKLQVLAELTRLRQICCDPALAYDDYKGGSAKLDTCMELISSAIDGGHKVLLFSQFTSMLDIISKRLDAEKVTHFTLTGSTSKEERRRLVERFQAGEASVFLISLRAGGVGLNLTAADMVIHYDPWWNLAAQNQATDRAYRIGQKRSVSVFKLICADTIEERIVAMQESKRELAESLLSGEAVSSSSLTRDEVLALLQA